MAVDDGLQGFGIIEPENLRGGVEVAIVLDQRQYTLAVTASRAGLPGEDQARGKATVGDLEHRAQIVHAAHVCCAEQIAGGIGDEPGAGIPTIAAVKAGEDSRDASVGGVGFGELEHRAAIVCPAERCGPKQVPIPVYEQASWGIRTVGAVEVVQNCGSASYSPIFMTAV